MSFPKLRLNAALRLGRCARAHSSGPQHAKVQAFPFALSLEGALDLVSPFAAGFHGEKVLGTVLKSLLPSGLPITLDVIKPTRTQAVYIPAWIIDSEVELEANQKRATVFSQNSYLPGFNFKPLSDIAFPASELKDLTPQNLTPELLQDGDGVTNVVCLPFTTSPLTLCIPEDILSKEELRISEDLVINPSTLKPNFLAVYPVLVPVVLVQFQRGDNAITFIVEAWEGARRFISKPSGTSTFPPYEFFAAQVADSTDDDGFLYWHGEQAPFAEVDFVTLREPSGVDAASEIQEYLQGARKGHWDSVEFKPVDDAVFEDPRVRKISATELEANAEWLKSGVELAGIEHTVKLLRGQNTRVISLTPSLGKAKDGDSANTAKDYITILQEKAEEKRIERNEAKPTWWKEWETSQTPPVPET